MKTENDKKKTIKEVREKADALIAGGVSNQTLLLEALPVLADLDERVEIAEKSLAASVKSLAMLSELCSNYALRHESVFDGKQLIASQQGVRVGNIVCGDVAYHFANGYNGYERDDGGKLTQDFLAALPEAWRKQKFTLSTSGIAASEPTDKTLAKHHLRQKVKNEWSLIKNISALNGEL